MTVCCLGSLSTAAVELGYTQSAISRQIAGLERQVGAQLIERHARGIRPTAAGEAFRRHAQATVNEAERAIRAARDARDGSPAQPLAVGATPSLAAGVVPAAMRRLLDETGPLPWNLVPGLTWELHERTVNGELDIAVVTDAPPGLPSDPRLERQLLGIERDDRRAPGRPPPRRKRTGADRGAGQRDLGRGQRRLSSTAAPACRPCGVTVRIDLNAADLPGKIALVATGHAIALVPGVLATTLRADVTTLALVNPPTRGIYAVLPRYDPHPSASLLLHQLMMSFRLGRADLPLSAMPHRDVLARCEPWYRDGARTPALFGQLKWMYVTGWSSKSFGAAPVTLCSSSKNPSPWMFTLR